ncbi:uncharacterized protein LOC115307320, partial [Manacus vitellinus]|uniref:uncharacterized protein LOC115307320 n=1 Tax=Manacus vitellinus TaxID=328815 RepID=UPI00115E7861
MLYGKRGGHHIAARSAYRRILSESARKLNSQGSQLGNCIERARPYYEARRRAKEAQQETQRAALRYERAVGMHNAAREMVFVAEQGVAAGKNRLDPTWQEMLNHATRKVGHGGRGRTEPDPLPAEEIAISWPRITAFAESHRRRGLVSGVEAEGEQGQPEPTQVAPPGVSGDGGVNPDLRRQLGLILQTAGRTQVEKMLRELVREQGQGGKRRNRKKAPKDGGTSRQGLWVPRVSPGVSQVSPEVSWVSPQVFQVSPEVSQVSPEVFQVSPQVSPEVSPQ